MTLQSTPPISLTNIQTEFGGAAPTSLSEYYAGGAYVPSGTTGVNGPVPSSGTISFSHFYGTSRILDTQVTTNGSATGGGFTDYGFVQGSFGACTDGTSNIYAGATIKELYLNGALNVVFLTIAGSRANSGWTKMSLNGVDYLRASASYATGGDTAWTWAPSGNQFLGGTTTAVFS